MKATLRALNGFGLGARAGESGRLSDPREWLRSQLKGGAPLVPPPPEASDEAIADAIRAFRSIPQGDDQQRRQARQEARRQLVAIAAAESHAALGERVTTTRPFVERLVGFWSNHLCVSTQGKVLVAPLAGGYERDAIRPHVLGRFADMVLASARHPAMLAYLDNLLSIGPNSRGARLGRRGGPQRGLNENYARELLELHTLGVNGGYAQQDVQELAKILTGWTVEGLGPGARGGRFATGRRSDEMGFTFAEPLHEPGAKTVLGASYAEAGVAEGERVIRDLCRHASTARFVAGKLVAHFVSDEPPAAAVDRIARVFRDSDGDLRAVSMALIELPEAWANGARKFRTPQDWLVAVLRAANTVDAPPAVTQLVRQLRQPLWAPASPKGFSDAMADWADPDALLNRAELARTVARRLRLPRLEPRELLDVVDVPAGDELPRMLADATIRADERLALLFAGPAFQWR